MSNFKYAPSYFIGPLADGKPAIVDGPENAREYALVLSRPQPFHAIKAEKTASVEKERFAALTAQTEASELSRPAVKPLVFVQEEDLKTSYVAPTPFGNEYITALDSGKFHYNNYDYETLEEAKAAAEAHWQQKIGKCLDIRPKLPEDPEEHRAYEDRE